VEEVSSTLPPPQALENQTHSSYFSSGGAGPFLSEVEYSGSSPALAETDDKILEDKKLAPGFGNQPIPRHFNDCLRDSWAVLNELAPEAAGNSAL